MSTRESAIAAISETLVGLDPGPLAELRRMEPGGPAPAAFWRIVAANGLDATEIETWQRIVQVMAILTDKGPPASRSKLHERERKLGAVLCDGGDRDWGHEAEASRPVVSEARLARFLALPHAARGAALGRLARMIASTRAPGDGVNCMDIAMLLLSPTNPTSLALTYYTRLDRANRSRLKEGPA